ncbi:MAG: Crp/Fnr family transcriptional regulator [Hyphomicrobiales bacterium]|nr:Crp/Fnr family transcriptional regulator [Hyphomicrobiales bacterium]
MRCILDFCGGLPERMVPAGETLLTEGEETNKLYILIDGQVEILKGEIQVDVHSDPGAVFGETSVLLDVPHTASVKTQEPSRLYIVEDASAFLQAHPDIAYFVAKLLARRVHRVTRYLADLKEQFSHYADHMGMVDEVLETLLHVQDEEFLPGSDRHPDPTI